VILVDNKNVNLFVVFIMLASVVFAYNGLAQQSLLQMLAGLYSLLLGVLIVIITPAGSKAKPKKSKRRRK
tara:strand:+ start:211 stop:420 length:210 start_codon:yes stop_codon:yes gene_type:complete